MGDTLGPSDLRGLVGSLRAESFEIEVEVVDHRLPRSRTSGRAPAQEQPWHEILMRPLDPEGPDEDEGDPSASNSSATMPTELELTLEAAGWRGCYELTMSTERRAGVLCFNGRARLASSQRVTLEPAGQGSKARPVMALRRSLDRDLWRDHHGDWHAVLDWLGRGDNLLPGRAALHRSLAIWLRGCDAAVGQRSDDLIGEFIAAKKDLRAALPGPMSLRKYGLRESPWVIAAEWFGPFVVRLIVGAGQGQGAYSSAAFYELQRSLGSLGLLLSDTRAFVIDKGLELGDRPLEMVHLGQFDLRGISGRRARLRGARLSGAWLDGVDLSGADLRRAQLSRIFLGDSKLQGADLRGAVLRAADLSDAHLQAADLRGADLTKAELAGARVQDTDLRGADLRGATISGAQLRVARVEGDWWDSQVE